MSSATRFILTQTKDPSNVGAAARALKTMGFKELVLVNPRDPNIISHKRCVASASGALDVLWNARIVDNLAEALKGTEIWCGTGMPVDMARKREPRLYTEPRLYFDTLLSQSIDVPPVSFVFGNEQRGMTNEDLDLCHVVLGVPTNPKFGSLNLASAVQLIAYDWRQAMGGFPVDSC